MSPRVVALFWGVWSVAACGGGDNFSGANAKASAARKPVAGADAKPAAIKPPPTTRPASVPPPAFTPPTTVPVAAPVTTAIPPAPVTPPPQGAITQGSFTVWTEPADPAPFQDYTVVIAVKLPPGTSNYDASDLSGSVEGTDGYHQGIGDGGSQPFEFLGTSAHLRLFVPGGADHVRDTVKVSSTLLNESQSVGIEF